MVGPRAKKATPEQELKLRAVTASRKDVKAWKEGFQEWVKQQEVEQSAMVNLRLHNAIVDAHKSGVSIAAIMRAYGTSDRKTILSVLRDTETALPAQVAHEIDGVVFSPFADGFLVTVKDFDRLGHPRNRGKVAVSGQARWSMVEGRPLAFGDRNDVYYEMNVLTGPLSPLQEAAVSWYQANVGVDTDADAHYSSDNEIEETIDI